jgi:hypothetical protein
LARIAAGLRRRPLTLLCIASLVLLAGTASPAMGGPTAQGVAAGVLAKAKRALSLAKSADRRSKLALKKAGTPGPQGPPGQPGSRGSEGFDGSDGARGPKGATGPQGPAGAHGADGADGTDGAAGADGTDGADGGDGATGPPGPTASRSVSANADVDISAAATVADLSSAPLVVPFAGRVMATATVQVRNPEAQPREGRCKLQILNTLDPEAGTSDISQIYAFDLPAEAGYDTTLTVSGAASKPAGTYNVSLVCNETDGQSLSALHANLQVWAAD